MSESSGPNDWNQKIIDEFRANAGRVDGYFEGAPMILIHHIGARSGKERVNPLTYLPDGNDMVITATKSGAPTNPDWYYNLKEHPRITVEVGTATFPVEATEVPPWGEPVCTFYDRTSRKPSARAVHDPALAERIEAIWQRSRRRPTRFAMPLLMLTPEPPGTDPEIWTIELP